MTSIQNITNIDSAILRDVVMTITPEIQESLSYQGDDLAIERDGELLALTDSVVALRDEAGVAGDLGMVALCDAVLEAV